MNTKPAIRYGPVFWATVFCLLSTADVARSQGISSDSARVLAAEVEAALVGLLDGFYPRVVDTTYGGFLSTFDADWNPQGDQRKLIVTQSRHVWTLSKAALELPDRREAYLAMAEQGYRFLRDRMWDHLNGGFMSLVSREGNLIVGTDGFTRGKTAYGNAFAIYALAAFHESSGNEEALRLAKAAFRWLDRSAHDREYGGYFQFMTDDGRPIREGFGQHPAKDQNSSIHLLEALTELYRVWPDNTVRDRLSEMLIVVRDTIATGQGYLRLFFQPDWTPISYRDSSEAVQRAHLGVDHVSYGHDIETAFLMDEAARALGSQDPRTLYQGKKMVDHALAYGWDAKFGGFYDGGYYFKPQSPPEVVMGIKTWWVEAEGLNALLLMSSRFPDDARGYFDRFIEQWRYVQRYLIDAERGGWYWGGLDRDPERRDYLKADIWKAGYHDGRALMHVRSILRKWSG